MHSGYTDFSFKLSKWTKFLKVVDSSSEKALLYIVTFHNVGVLFIICFVFNFWMTH